MNVILTVTLNAAIDKTYYVPRFLPGEVARASRVYSEPGGKGINVARVIRQLNVPVMATGFVGGSNGEFIERGLRKQAIDHDFVHVDEESRLCLNLMDEQSGVSTEVLEPGPHITQQAMDQLQEKVAFLAQKSRIVCFSGSLPKGVPTGFYGELIRIVQMRGALAFLDASGESLIKGVEAAPFFIKPNETEIDQLFGQLTTERSGEGGIPSAPRDRLKSLMNCGIRSVSISMGAAGCLSLYNGTIYRTKAPLITAVNTVGCGDAFVAGMAVGVAREMGFEDCLKLAVAAGSANALSDRAGSVHPEDVTRFIAQIRVDKE
jgi:tagatose 6-phosphate kinase